MVSYLCSLLHVQPLGQQVGNVDEAQQVVHIALYAAGHPRILNLHGKAAPVMKLASMHLCSTASFPWGYTGVASRLHRGYGLATDTGLNPASRLQAGY